MGKKTMLRLRTHELSFEVDEMTFCDCKTEGTKHDNVNLCVKIFPQLTRSTIFDVMRKLSHYHEFEENKDFEFIVEIKRVPKMTKEAPAVPNP